MNKKDIIFLIIIAAITVTGFIFGEKSTGIAIALIISIIYALNIYLPEKYNPLMKIKQLQDDENPSHFIPLIIFAAIVPAALIVYTGTYHADPVKQFAIISTTVITCLVFLITILINERNKVIYGTGLIYIYLAFLFLMILPNIFFDKTYEAFNYAMNYSMFFLTVFLGINLFRKENHIKVYLYVLLAIMALMGVSSLGEFFGYNFFGLASIQNYSRYGQRVVFTFGNPNFHAGFLLLSLQLVFALIMMAKGRVLKSIIGIVFLLNFFALIMTKTRGGNAFFIIGFFFQLALTGFIYFTSHDTKFKISFKNGMTLLIQMAIGLILTIAFFFGIFPNIEPLLSDKKIILLIISILILLSSVYYISRIIRQDLTLIKKISILLSITLGIISISLIGLTIISYIQPQLYTRLVSSIDNPVIALKSRYNALLGAVTLWKESPIIGHGLGCYYFFYSLKNPGDFRIFSQNKSYKHVHNEFLELMADGGILVLIAFLIMIAIVIRQVIKVLKNPESSPGLRYLGAGILTGIISMLIYNLFTLNLRYISTVYLFFVTIAMGYSLPFIDHKTRNSTEELDDKQGFLEKFTKQLKPEKKSISIGISIAITILSILIWFGIRPYYMAEKGLFKSKQTEMNFKFVLRRVPMQNIENFLKQKFPLFTEYRNDPDFRDKINEIKFLRDLRDEAIQTKDDEDKFPQKMKNYFQYRYMFESLFLQEYILEKKTLSWQPDNSYALFDIGVLYFLQSNICKNAMKSLPHLRDVILDDIYTINEKATGIYDRIEKVIPWYRDTVLKRSRSALYQTLVAIEQNDLELTSKKMDQALKYYLEYKKQDLYETETRLSLLFIYGLDQKYNKFKEEFIELMDNEMRKHFYFQWRTGSVEIYDATDSKLFIEKDTYKFSMNEDTIKKIYSEVNPEKMTIEKSETEIQKLAKSIGDLFYKNKTKDQKLPYDIYYQYVFRGGTPNLKRLVQNIYVKDLRKIFFEKYKIKDWLQVYGNYKALQKYGWNEVVDFRKYDVKRNREIFIDYWGRKTKQNYHISNWNEIMQNGNARMTYNQFLNKMFFVDVLDKNGFNKEYKTYTTKLKREGINL